MGEIYCSIHACGTISPLVRENDCSPKKSEFLLFEPILVPVALSDPQHHHCKLRKSTGLFHAFLTTVCPATTQWFSTTLSCWPTWHFIYLFHNSLFFTNVYANANNKRTFSQLFHFCWESLSIPSWPTVTVNGSQVRKNASRTSPRHTEHHFGSICLTINLELTCYGSDFPLTWSQDRKTLEKQKC